MSDIHIKGCMESEKHNDITMYIVLKCFDKSFAYL